MCVFIDYGLAIFYLEQYGNFDIVHSAGICASWVGLYEQTKAGRVRLANVVLRRLDVCSYAIHLTRDDVLDGNVRPLRSQCETPTACRLKEFPMTSQMY